MSQPAPPLLMMLIKNHKQQQSKKIYCVNCDVEIKKNHWCKDCWIKWKNGEKVKFSNHNNKLPDFCLISDEED